MMRTKDAIHQELVIEQARFAELERAREEARTKIELLRSELIAAQKTTSRPLPLLLRRAMQGSGNAGRQGQTFPIAVSRAHRCLPPPIREQEDRQPRLCTRLLKQMGTRPMSSQVRRQTPAIVIAALVNDLNALIDAQWRSIAR
jgi:hypothetical protein